LITFFADFDHADAAFIRLLFAAIYADYAAAYLRAACHAAIRHVMLADRAADSCWRLAPMAFCRLYRCRHYAAITPCDAFYVYATCFAMIDTRAMLRYDTICHALMMP